MTNKNILASMLIMGGLLLGANASAQLYAGGTVGNAKLDVNTAGTTDSKTSDTAYSIFGGYQFTKNLALETSYFSLGKATLTYGVVKGEFAGKGVDLTGVAKTDADNGWSAFARAGVAVVKGEITGSYLGYSASQSSNSTQLVAGLGVMYEYSDKIIIRGEYSRRKVEVKSGSTSQSENVPTFTIGLQYVF